MDLFVYGTLMDDALVVELTGHRFRKESAVLAGYRRMLPAHGYPFIVADERATVDGFVLYGVDVEALRHFDAYEDEGILYRRTEAVVTVAGRRLRCTTYIAIPNASVPTPA